MNEDIVITPVTHRPKKSLPAGRQADRLARLIAGLGALLSLIAATWFFAGFAENDTRPEHLASALVLTLILFSFAVIPFVLVAGFAHKAYRAGTRRAHLLWTLLLMLPWILLGGLAISYTPLPVWCGIIMTGFALLLSLWAVISLVIDARHAASDPVMSQQNERPNGEL